MCIKIESNGKRNRTKCQKDIYECNVMIHIKCIFTSIALYYNMCWQKVKLLQCDTVEVYAVKLRANIPNRKSVFKRTWLLFKLNIADKVFCNTHEIQIVYSENNPC